MYHSSRMEAVRFSASLILIVEIVDTILLAGLERG
jgi:hypothetical protein